MKKPKSRDPNTKNLAKITRLHGFIIEGETVMIQFATAEHDWADVILPLDEAAKLAVYFARSEEIRDRAGMPSISRH